MRTHLSIKGPGLVNNEAHCSLAGALLTKKEPIARLPFIHMALTSLKRAAQPVTEPCKASAEGHTMPDVWRGGGAQ